MHPELSALSAQGHFLVWQMRPTLLPLHRGQPARVLICPAGRWEPLRPHEELWVQRAVCPERMLLRELFENGWGWGFPFQATAPRRQAALWSCLLLQGGGQGPQQGLQQPWGTHTCLPFCVKHSALLLFWKGSQVFSIASASKDLVSPTQGWPRFAGQESCFDVRKCWWPVPCWVGTAPVGVALTWADHPQYFLVLTPLSRLQCDIGVSLQALTGTQWCQSEGLGPSYRVQVWMSVSVYVANYDLYYQLLIWSMNFFILSNNFTINRRQLRTESLLFPYLVQA